MSLCALHTLSYWKGGLCCPGEDGAIADVRLAQLNFTPEALEENVHTLLASISDIALGGSGTVNGVVARAKRRASPLRTASPELSLIPPLLAAAITRVLLSSTQGPGIELADA